MAISQDNRPIRIVIGTIPTDTYVLTAFRGREAISELFEFDLEIAAEETAPLDFDKVLGQPVKVECQMAGGNVRQIHGIVNRFTQVGKTDRFIVYRAKMAPVLWLLTRRQQSGIAQQTTTGDFINTMLGLLNGQTHVMELTQKYFPRNYLTLYRESFFDFISRLMEDEGMYYYYDHSGPKAELIVSDSRTKHRDLPGGKTLEFEASDDSSISEVIHSWRKSQDLHFGSVELTDHNFQRTDNPLLGLSFGLDSIKAGTVVHDLTVANRDRSKFLDTPGGYAHWRDDIDQNGGERDDVSNVFDDASRISSMQMAVVQALSLTIEGESSVARLTPGFIFTLKDHFDADGDYTVTSVEHTASFGLAESDAKKFKYSNTFTCIPAGMEFKSQYNTPRPVISGTHTAVVTGTEGAEIEPDKFGRVKVRFRWDPREPGEQLESSCWVRVAQQWAGRQWGFQFIPRIDDEVIVVFEEGDPDRPMIIGSVWNPDNMPIYDLPKNKTQSGIKTTSSPQGTTANFNEIKFEDKKGAEFISVHAENNMMTTVENVHSINVGSTAESSGSDTKTTGTMSTTVFGDTTFTVSKGDYTETIKAGKFTSTIKGDTSVVIQSGTYSHDVQTGTSTIHVAGDATETYDAEHLQTNKSGHKTHVTGGNHFIHVDAGDEYIKTSANTFIEAGGFYQCVAKSKIVMITGSSSIEMLSDGTINIKGVKITLDGSTFVAIIGGGATTEWKGGKIVENGGSGIEMTGSTIKLNS